METSSKDWFILILRMFAFCIGFFIILDYIFTCNIDTKKGNIIMLVVMLLTIIGFVIYRWRHIFGKNGSQVESMPPDVTSIDLIA